MSLCFLSLVDAVRTACERMKMSETTFIRRKRKCMEGVALNCKVCFFFVLSFVDNDYIAVGQEVELLTVVCNLNQKFSHD